MKLQFVLLLFTITILPLSASLAEAIEARQTQHLKSKRSLTVIPIKEVQKKTKKRKTKRSKTTKKIQDRTPGFALMFIGGLIILTLAIFLMGSAAHIVGGLAAALTFGLGLLWGAIASIVILVASIFLAKGIRENRTFNELHGKTEKALKKELVATTYQKFPHLSNSEVRAYNGYQVKVHKLEALIALKKKKKFFSTKKIQRLENSASDYQKRITYLEEKNSGQEKHQLNNQ